MSLDRMNRLLSPEADSGGGGAAADKATGGGDPAPKKERFADVPENLRDVVREYNEKFEGFDDTTRAELLADYDRLKAKERDEAGKAGGPPTDVPDSREKPEAGKSATKTEADRIAALEAQLQEMRDMARREQETARQKAEFGAWRERVREEIKRDELAADDPEFAKLAELAFLGEYVTDRPADTRAAIRRQIESLKKLTEKDLRKYVDRKTADARATIGESSSGGRPTKQVRPPGKNDVFDGTLLREMKEALRG